VPKLVIPFPQFALALESDYSKIFAVNDVVSGTFQNVTPATQIATENCPPAQALGKPVVKSWFRGASNSTENGIKIFSTSAVRLMKIRYGVADWEGVRH
jgi:hypothetical protein